MLSNIRLALMGEGFDNVTRVIGLKPSPLINGALKLLGDVGADEAYTIHGDRQPVLDVGSILELLPPVLQESGMEHTFVRAQDAQLLTGMVDLLVAHAGETGSDSEGALDVLKRVLASHRAQMSTKADTPNPPATEYSKTEAAQPSKAPDPVEVAGNSSSAS